MLLLLCLQLGHTRGDKGASASVRDNLRAQSERKRGEQSSRKKKTRGKLFQGQKFHWISMFFFPIRILLYIFTDDVMNCNELSSSSSLLGLFYYVRVLIHLRPHLLLAQLSEKKKLPARTREWKTFFFSSSHLHMMMMSSSTFWSMTHNWSFPSFPIAKYIHTALLCHLIFIIVHCASSSKKLFHFCSLSLFYYFFFTSFFEGLFLRLSASQQRSENEIRKKYQNSMAEDAAEMLGRLLTPPRMLFFSSHFLPPSLPPFFSFLPHHHRLHSLLRAVKKLNFHRQFFVGLRAHLIQLIAGFHLENFSKLGRDLLRENLFTFSRKNSSKVEWIKLVAAASLVFSHGHPRV